MDKEGRTLRIREVAAGPPSGNIDITITGPDYDDIASVARELSADISTIDGVVNVETT